MLPDDAPEPPLEAVDDGPAAKAPVRTCILTRERGERGAMVRLALGPDGGVWPDLAARLPGRGAWLAADGEALAAAVANGRLRGQLARAWQTKPPQVPADLPQRIAEGLRRRLLDRLGLEHRAGALMFGSDRLGEAARAGRLVLLLHAQDAAPDGVGKLEQAMRVGERRPGIRLAVPRDALSAALGRDNSVHLGVSASQAASRILLDAARLHAWIKHDGAIGRRAPGRDDDGGVERPRVKAEGDE